MDREISDLELQYMLRIADRLGLSSEDVNRVIKEEIPFSPPIHESTRLVLFHQLLILIYVDGKIDKKELEFLKGLGLKLGLNPYAVSEILEILKNNAEEGIDPKKITEIFKNYNN
jgi:uncharacterized tellurite resistance protein B-like protein